MRCFLLMDDHRTLESIDGRYGRIRHGSLRDRMDEQGEPVRSVIEDVSKYSQQKSVLMG